MAESKDRVQVEILADTRRAVSELGKMELKAREAKERLKGLKKGTQEFGEAQKAFKEASEKVDALRERLGLAGMSMQQLRRYHGELKRQIDRETYGTERWAELKGRIQDVSRAIRTQRDELAGTNTLWSRLSAEAKQFGIAALAYLGAQELVGQVSNMVRGLADLSDAIADVQKTTGLSRQGVEALSKEFKKMDTRTSRKELLGLAEIAGKLGVKGKEDVLGFVKAADQLNVALGKDLGTDAEGAIKAVGKLVDIFKVKDRFGLEQGLLKVGSAINSLGAASTASEGYLVDFAKRLGGIAPNANISIDKVLGLGATLDQLGQSSEASSTAVAQLFVALAQDMPAFAKLAGLSVEEFSEKLAKDANEAFIKVLEGSKSASGGLAGMASTLTKLGIDGARAAAVAGVLSNNIEVLRGQQKLANEEFGKGTSLTDEFNTKNTNLAATVEKIQKRLAGIFVNSAFMRGLEDLLGGFERMTRANADLSEGLRGQGEALMESKAQFNAEMAVLESGNLSASERSRLIRRMNEAYGDFLPRLIEEKDTTEGLWEVQKKANEAFAHAIILKARQADMTERINRQIQLEKDNVRDQMRLTEARISLERTLSDGQSGNRAANSLSGIDSKSEGARQAVANLEVAIKAREREVAEIQKSIEKEQTLYDAILSRRKLSQEDPATSKGKGKGKGENGDGGDPILSDEQKKEIEAEKKKHEALIEQWKDFRAKIRALEGENAIEALAEDEREFARIDAKYQALLSEAESFHRQKGATDEEYEAEAKAIRAQWDAELIAEEEARHAKAIERAKAFHSEMEALAMEALPDEAQEFARIDAKYEALMQKARDFHAEGLISEEEFYLAMGSLYERYAAEHLAKQEELNKKAAKEAEDARDKELGEIADYYSGMGQMLSEFSNLVSATNRLIATQGAKQSEFQKQLALIAIGIDTAAALSKAIAGAATAAAMSGPGAPFVLAANIISMGTAVLSGMARAKEYLAKSDKPEVPSFAKGGPVGGMPLIEGEGFTGAGLPFRDATGKRPAGLALLHGNEYVVPENLLFGNPWVADQVAIIEALRLGRGFAQGGPSGEMPIPRPEGGQGMEQVLARLEAIERAVLRLDRPMRAYFTADDGEAYDEYRAQDESNRNISKL